MKTNIFNTQYREVVAMVSKFDAWRPQLTDFIKKESPDLCKDTLNHLIDEFGKYVIAGIFSNRKLGMFSHDVDEYVWHPLILNSRTYQHFCKDVLGRPLHHMPAMDGEITKEEQLSSARELANALLDTFEGPVSQTWGLTYKVAQKSIGVEKLATAPCGMGCDCSNAGEVNTAFPGCSGDSCQSCGVDSRESCRGGGSCSMCALGLLDDKNLDSNSCKSCSVLYESCYRTCFECQSCGSVLDEGFDCRIDNTLTEYDVI